MTWCQYFACQAGLALNVPLKGPLCPPKATQAHIYVNLGFLGHLPRWWALDVPKAEGSHPGLSDATPVPGHSLCVPCSPRMPTQGVLTEGKVTLQAMITRTSPHLSSDTHVSFPQSSAAGQSAELTVGSLSLCKELSHLCSHSILWR